jgi:hypothetical protein
LLCSWKFVGLVRNECFQASLRKQRQLTHPAELRAAKSTGDRLLRKTPLKSVLGAEPGLSDLLPDLYSIVEPIAEVLYHLRPCSIPISARIASFAGCFQAVSLRRSNQIDAHRS